MPLYLLGLRVGSERVCDMAEQVPTCQKYQDVARHWVGVNLVERP